jgi:hypothetical protein
VSSGQALSELPEDANSLGFAQMKLVNSCETFCNEPSEPRKVGARRGDDFSPRICARSAVLMSINLECFSLGKAFSFWVPPQGWREKFCETTESRKLLVELRLRLFSFAREVVTDRIIPITMNVTFKLVCRHDCLPELSGDF